MALFTFRYINCVPNFNKVCKGLLYCTVSNTSTSINFENDEEFRVLELYPKKTFERKTTTKFVDTQIMPPREKRMPIDQDWPSVWPTPRTFQPSVVPLPLYQGYSPKKAPPGKYANAELMKIPNFLHLTPPAIKRHCSAIKKFCTVWPEVLDTDEKCEDNFALEVITTDYCHSSPTIRDDRSRIVTLKIRLKDIQLDYHAKDKMIRLAGEDRYDKTSDMLTIVADRCPLRKQNYDYLMYVLAALYHESKIIEPWEAEKTEDDMEKFFFEGSRHQNLIMNTINFIRTSSGQQELTALELKEYKDVIDYGTCVSEIINEGESSESIQNYKSCVAKVLDLNTIDQCKILSSK